MVTSSYRAFKFRALASCVWLFLFNGQSLRLFLSLAFSLMTSAGRPFCVVGLLRGFAPFRVFSLLLLTCCV